MWVWTVFVSIWPCCELATCTQCTRPLLIPMTWNLGRSEHRKWMDRCLFLLSPMRFMRVTKASTDHHKTEHLSLCFQPPEKTFSFLLNLVKWCKEHHCYNRCHKGTSNAPLEIQRPWSVLDFDWTVRQKAEQRRGNRRTHRAQTTLITSYSPAAVV